MFPKQSQLFVQTRLPLMQVVPAVEQSNEDYIARKFSLTVDYLRITETYRDISLTKVCSKLLKKLEVNRCGPLESSIARAL